MQGAGISTAAGSKLAVLDKLHVKRYLCLSSLVSVPDFRSGMDTKVETGLYIQYQPNVK